MLGPQRVLLEGPLGFPGQRLLTASLGAGRVGGEPAKVSKFPFSIFTTVVALFKMLFSVLSFPFSKVPSPAVERWREFLTPGFVG